MRFLVIPTTIATAVLLTGCAVPARHPELDRELVQAATHGDTAGVTAAVAAGAGANARGEGGWTALMLAAKAGDVRSVQTLLGKRANVDARTDLNETALMVAHPDVTESLLAAGPDLNARDQGGATALIRTRDIAKARALVAAGADVNVTDYDGATALLRSAAWGDIEIVDLLLQSRADTDIPMRDGRTALIVAAHNGNADAVRSLLRAGVDPEKQSMEGWRAIHYAAMNVRPDSLEALLGAGAEVDPRTVDGQTALVIAAREGHAKNVALLLARGADPKIRTASGETALSWAHIKRHPDIVELLEEAGGVGPLPVAAEAETDGSESRDVGHTLDGRSERERAAVAAQQQLVHGSLEVSTTDIATDGRVAKMRGRVRSTYEQPVHGIRYVVTILGNNTDGLQPLDRYEREVDTSIEPGGSVFMRLDVESMYFGSGGFFNIGAYPVKIGDREVPPPPGWSGN